MARIGHSTRTRALALLSALTLGALTLTHAVASPSPQTHNGQVPMGPSYLSPTSSIPSGAQPVDLTFDPVSSSTSGFGGPLRIELPFDPISSSSHSSKSGYSVEQQIAAQRGEFVHLSHKDFPQVSVRIKRVNEGNGVNALNEESDEEAFCDPTVTSWSGYIDTIDGKSLFFYFFESRSNPSTDPVIMWINGGPGCSSALGLFQELGPCRVPLTHGKGRAGPPINGTDWNPHSWNNRASVFFLDQPVGVGFSYSRYGIAVGDTEDASKDVYKFLRIFFSAFNRFADLDFHMAGESYGGRYLPVFASEVVDRNAELVRAQKKSPEKKHKRPEGYVNVKSVLIGNGLTDQALLASSYYDFTCTKKGGVDPVLSIESCKRLASWAPRCDRWLKAKCRDTYDADECSIARERCSDEFSQPYLATGLNPYNILDGCESGLAETLCYPVMADIIKYLNREDTRALLGVPPVSELGEFHSCSDKVALDFQWHNDEALDNGLNVAGLLERGIPVLIYVGTLDWICNWVGNKRWVQALDWSGKAEFHSAPNYHWVVDGEEAGETQSGGGLTWATVLGAGHMVPYDRPFQALQMLHRWLDGQAL